MANEIKYYLGEEALLAIKNNLYDKFALNSSVDFLIDIADDKTCDKTSAEINTAYTSGRVLKARYQNVVFTFVEYDSHKNQYLFTNIFNSNTDGNVIIGGKIFITTTNETPVVEYGLINEFFTPQSSTNLTTTKKNVIQAINEVNEKATDAIEQSNIQSDWSINDETNPAYINNRPFYTTDPVEVELCNDTYNFSPQTEDGITLYTTQVDIDNKYFTHEEGQAIKVVYDGTEYNCTTKFLSAMHVYYIGNASIINVLGLSEENTGEKFFYPLGNATLFSSESTAQHTIVISVEDVIDVPIPHKYLGLNVWTGAGENSVVINDSDNVASGYSAFAAGHSATASGSYSHAEGSNVVASGDNSHAEGNSTTASNYNSHAEGSNTVASGHSAHAEGASTEASGQGSHTEGQNTKASAWNTHAEGQGTEAAGRSQHVFGEYNIVDRSTSGVAQRAKYIQIAGNGNSANAKSNAYTLDWSGNAWFKGNVKVGGTGQDDTNAKTLATTDDLSWNNLKDRPFYSDDNVTIYESTITTSDLDGMYGVIDQSDVAKTIPALIEGETYTITFDNDVYTCVCHYGIYLGNLSLLQAGDNTNEPFAVIVQTGFMFGVATTDTTSATHTIKIEGPTIKTLDEKYLPELPYVTMQEGNQYWVSKSAFAPTNSNLTYKGKSYMTNHEYFLFFLTNEGIWKISLVINSSTQIPSSSNFRMNYASSDGTLSFYWRNESETTEITTAMHAYLHDVNTGNTIRRESNVQSVTIGAYTKKSHNVDFYINKSNPQDAKILRSFDDYVETYSQDEVDALIASIKPKSTTVTISAANWTGNANPWSQVVSVNGVTENSKLDLQPTAQQIVALQDAEVSIMLQNDSGIITAWAIGKKPTVDYTFDVLITEVSVI